MLYTFMTPTLADTVTVKTATELKQLFDNKANQIVVGADIEGSFEIKKKIVILPLISEVIQLLQMDMHSLWESEQKVSINNGKIVAQNKRCSHI